MSGYPFLLRLYEDSLAAPTGLTPTVECFIRFDHACRSTWNHCEPFRARTHVNLARQL